jgi:hypothetical protein
VTARFTNRGIRLTAACTVALLAVVGGALAYYTTAGSGTGSASIGSPAELTIIASTPASGLLYPGSTHGEVDATISNPNPFPVRVNSLVLDGGGIVPEGAPGCDASVLHYTAQDDAGQGWDVPARVGATDGELDVQLTDAISMDSSAQNECQGASFTVHLQPGP